MRADRMSRLTGLVTKSFAPGLQATDLLGFPRVGGEHDDRQGAQFFPLAGAQAAANFRTVEPRHFEIEDEQIRRGARREAQGFIAIGGLVDLEARSLQSLAEQSARNCPHHRRGECGAGGRAALFRD